MVLQIKTNKMEQTSLEQFKWMVDTQYPSIKKYIVSEDEHHVVIEDPMGDMIFGSNKDLSALFDFPCPFPFKKITTSYKEKDACFLLKIDLR